MVPRQRIPDHVRDYDTMNARAETVGKLRSFAKPWAACQLGLVTAQAVFEPRYPALPDLDVPNRDEVIKVVLKQKSERWGVSVASGDPFAVAGVWLAWEEPDGGESYSFTMITVNADEHLLLRQFHKHLDRDGKPNEKRGVVILRPDQYDDWLNCRDPEIARTFLSLLPADALSMEAAPRTTKTRRATASADPSNGTLF
nr:SOS response-associated peptidase family protein [Burkholderia sp. Ac-20353]